MTVSNACSLVTSPISNGPFLAPHKAEQIDAGNTEIPADIRYIVGSLCVSFLCGRGFLRYDHAAFHFCEGDDVGIRRLIKALWVRKIWISRLNTGRFNLHQRVEGYEKRWVLF